MISVLLACSGILVGSFDAAVGHQIMISARRSAHTGEAVVPTSLAWLRADAALVAVDDEQWHVVFLDYDKILYCAWDHTPSYLTRVNIFSAMNKFVGKQMQPGSLSYLDQMALTESQSP